MSLRTYITGISIFILLLIIISSNGCTKTSDQSPSTGLAKFKLEKKTKSGLFVVGGVSVAGSPNFVIDSNGNIYYPDTNHWKIVKIDSTGTSTTFAGSTDGNADGTGTAAQFSRPYQIAIDKQDNLYVIDYGTYSLRKITQGAVVTTVVTFPGPELPSRIVISSTGDFFYTEVIPWSTTNKIKKLSNGTVTTLAGSGSAGFTNGTGTAASFNNPDYLVIDSQDNLYVSDLGNFVIRKITQAGVVTTYSGDGVQSVKNGDNTISEFYFYQNLGYLTIDSTDNLLVGDMAGNTGYIRKIDTNGTTSTFCGGGSTTDINVEGSCGDIGIWVNGGISVAPDGSVYFIAGDYMYRIYEQ